jgi:hypothetical protein
MKKAVFQANKIPMAAGSWPKESYKNKGLGSKKCGRGWVGVKKFSGGTGPGCRRSTSKKSGKGGLTDKQREASAGLAAKIRAEKGFKPLKARESDVKNIKRGNDDRTVGTASGSRSNQESRIRTAREDLTQKADLSKVPERHRKHLNANQQAGVALAIKALDTHGGFLLADGTGVGKTRQLLSIADNYAQQGKKVVIVSKAEVLKPDWKKGTASGSFNSDGDLMGIKPKLIRDEQLEAGKVHLTTYQNLIKLKKAGIDKNTVVLYDEAHSLKNYGSAQTKHGGEISAAAGKVLFATATPADKPLQLGYLERAGVFAGNSRSKINGWLGYELVDQHVGGGEYVKKWEKKSGVSAEQTHARMAGLFDEMTERGLMIKREISMEGVPVSFKKIQIPDEARQVQTAIDDRFDGGGLEEAQKLMHQRRQLEPYKIPGAIDSVKEALAKGRQAIVFVSRVNESELKDTEGEGIASSDGTAKTLKAALKAAGIEDVAELHGGNTASASKKAMGSFQDGKSRVIIATVESGGTGVNLDDTTGNNPRSLIMLTPPFSAVDNVQAIGRVWRMSTKSTPDITYLTTDTAVDQWNSRIIANKMGTLNATINGMTAEAATSTQSERPPKPAPKDPNAPPPGAIVNKYGGRTASGQWIAAGEGFTKKVNGRWEVFAKLAIKTDSIAKHWRRSISA